MSGRLLTAAEAAAELGRSVEWTRSLLADGTIPGGRKVRGRWMVPREQLEAWVAGGCPAKEDPADALRYTPFPRVMRRTVAA